ncbi:YqaJ viral recombinase family protein [Terasakiella pusilla]|uniref:YqaJ viral recombinase family nuclease n=1 Tax=Terasakiella pusilla TaxID=64973 RepID=UPI003AA7E2FB
MKVKSIIPRDEAHWHELRAQHIGGSEVAALFGLSSFMTPFELWHIKKGNIEAPNLDDNERVFWGNVLEPAIAKGIAQLEGFQIRKVHRYLSSEDVPGMGASLDYQIINHQRGTAPFEIKAVDYLEHRDWPEENGVKTPPMKYALQVQSQIALLNSKWGCLGALVSGNTPEKFNFDRHNGVIAKLSGGIEDFWYSISTGKEPEPDFNKDYRTIEQLYGPDANSFEDRTGDDQLLGLCAAYVGAREDEKAASKSKEALRGKIIKRIGKKARVKVDQFTIARGAQFRIIEKAQSGEDGFESYELPSLPDTSKTFLNKPKDLGQIASIF